MVKISLKIRYSKINSQKATVLECCVVDTCRQIELPGEFIFNIILKLMLKSQKPLLTQKYIDDILLDHRCYYTFQEYIIIFIFINII